MQTFKLQHKICSAKNVPWKKLDKNTKPSVALVTKCYFGHLFILDHYFCMFYSSVFRSSLPPASVMYCLPQEKKNQLQDLSFGNVQYGTSYTVQIQQFILARSALSEKKSGILFYFIFLSFRKQYGLHQCYKEMLNIYCWIFSC